jgi:hypothetical protein
MSLGGVGRSLGGVWEEFGRRCEELGGDVRRCEEM